MGSQGRFGQSKEFLELVKSIGEARSKAEEDRIVVHEIETLKHRISELDIPKRKMKEYIIRLVYVEMLGHDASFGYIHAVKMTHDDSLLLKRTGYLAVTLFLNEDHDLIILIVNTIQKDHDPQLRWLCLSRERERGRVLEAGEEEEERREKRKKKRERKNRKRKK
jgi:AP-4 complex subunit epsilon-1